MMIFFGLMLLTFNLYVLVKGNFANKFQLEIIEFAENKNKTITEKEIKLLINLLFYLVFSIGYLLTTTLFLVAALKVDTILIPTLIMLLWIVVSFPINHIKHKRKTKDYYIKRYSKNRSIGGTLSSVIYCSYYIYILALLIF